jgi:hypothetical protein
MSSVRHRRKTTGFKIIILLLTIFDGIMGCRRNGLSEQWAGGIMGRRSNGHLSLFPFDNDMKKAHFGTKICIYHEKTVSVYQRNTIFTVYLKKSRNNPPNEYKD